MENQQQEQEQQPPPPPPPPQQKEAGGAEQQMEAESSEEGEEEEEEETGRGSSDDQLAPRKPRAAFAVPSSSDDDESTASQDEIESSSSEEEEEEEDSPSLVCDMNKLLAAQQRFLSIQPTSGGVHHSCQLVLANHDNLVNMPHAFISLTMAPLVRKAALDEAVQDADVADVYRAALCGMARSPRWLLPLSFYHGLLEDLDIRSYIDYRGLRRLLEDVGLLEREPSAPAPALAATEVEEGAGEGPAEICDAERGPSRDRLSLTTMAYALLGLWPDSKKLGSKIFRQVSLATQPAT